MSHCGQVTIQLNIERHYESLKALKIARNKGHLELSASNGWCERIFLRNNLSLQEQELHEQKFVISLIIVALKKVEN